MALQANHGAGVAEPPHEDMEGSFSSMVRVKTAGPGIRQGRGDAGFAAGGLALSIAFIDRRQWSGPPSRSRSLRTCTPTFHSRCLNAQPYRCHQRTVLLPAVTLAASPLDVRASIGS